MTVRVVSAVFFVVIDRITRQDVLVGEERVFTDAGIHHSDGDALAFGGLPRRGRLDLVSHPSVVRRVGVVLSQGRARGGCDDGCSCESCGSSSEGGSEA